MKEIENIFSKSPTKKEDLCPNPKVKIIIDTREKQSLIASKLIEKRANIQFENLEIGDYLIGEATVERKTFTDFVNSMIDKRLLNQLINLTACKNPLLLIEGNTSHSKIHPNAIKGMLLSVALDFKIPIIQTRDESETSEFLITLARKYEKEKINPSIRPAKKIKTLEEQKQFILEGFPSIGPSTSKKLLSHFSSLNEIFNASEEELENSGLNKEKVKDFKRILN